MLKHFVPLVLMEKILQPRPKAFSESLADKNLSFSSVDFLLNLEHKVLTKCLF